MYNGFKFTKSIEERGIIMKGRVLGLSGSPIKNSNIDRTIQAVMDACGQDGEFVKLSRYDVRPCRACLGCVEDNRCVQKDDYTGQLEGKVKEADALIIGGFPTFASLDARTKAFCERTYSLRHQRLLTRGKLGVVVAGGYKANDKVEDWLKLFFKAQGMELVGSMKTCGNTTCLVCGKGEECDLSNVKTVFGQDACIEDSMFNDFDSSPELQEQASKLGQDLHEKLKVLESYK